MAFFFFQRHWCFSRPHLDRKSRIALYEVDRLKVSSVSRQAYTGTIRAKLITNTCEQVFFLFTLPAAMTATSDSTAFGPHVCFVGVDMNWAEKFTPIIFLPRYGLAADALIALGGLSAAARDGDGGEARRMLTLTKESLNDILTIGVNNDLNKTN